MGNYSKQINFNNIYHEKLPYVSHNISFKKEKLSSKLASINVMIKLQEYVLLMSTGTEHLILYVYIFSNKFFSPLMNVFNHRNKKL